MPDLMQEYIIALADQGIFRGHPVARRLLWSVLLDEVQILITNRYDVVFIPCVDDAASFHPEQQIARKTNRAEQRLQTLERMPALEQVEDRLVGRVCGWDVLDLDAICLCLRGRSCSRLRHR